MIQTRWVQRTSGFRVKVIGKGYMININGQSRVEWTLPGQTMQDAVARGYSHLVAHAQHVHHASHNCRLLEVFHLHDLDLPAFSCSLHVMVGMQESIGGGGGGGGKEVEGLQQPFSYRPSLSKAGGRVTCLSTTNALDY